MLATTLEAAAEVGSGASAAGAAAAVVWRAARGAHGGAGCTIFAGFVKTRKSGVRTPENTQLAKKPISHRTGIIDFVAIAALDASYEATHKKSQVGWDSIYK